MTGKEVIGTRGGGGIDDEVTGEVDNAGNQLAICHVRSTGH